MGIAAAYEGLDALLADPNVHILYIATLTRPICSNFAALAAGKAILCESPDLSPTKWIIARP